MPNGTSASRHLTLLVWRPDREELETQEIAEVLGTPPDGTRIEFAFVVEGLAEKCHRYAGTYRNQSLELERAYPSVTAGVLSDALAWSIRFLIRSRSR